MPLRARKSVTHRMIAEVSKGAAALREACAAEPAYQTADDLWKGLKRNDLAAQLVLTFAQQLRFNKRTRHSLPTAKRQEDKRWVRILRQEGWNLYLSTGSTKQEKTRKHNRVPNANRKTNKITTWTSRRHRRYSGRTGSSNTQRKVVTAACIVLRAMDGQLVPGSIHDTPRRK